MKRFAVVTCLALLFAIGNQSQAQFNNAGVLWGLSAGAAHGNNFNDDRWGMQYRVHIQFEVIPSILAIQPGLGYASLWAPGIYSAQTGIADVRFLVTPFTLQNLHPYAYAGAAISKCLNIGGTDYLPMVPLGLGVRTMISRGTYLDLTGGFNLSLSDDLDGRTRSLANVNPITNERQDGFYGFTVGLSFAF
jgi:hypothetical protein